MFRNKRGGKHKQAVAAATATEGATNNNRNSNTTIASNKNTPSTIKGSSGLLQVRLHEISNAGV